MANFSQQLDDIMNRVRDDNRAAADDLQRRLLEAHNNFIALGEACGMRFVVAAHLEHNQVEQLPELAVPRRLDFGNDDAQDDGVWDAGAGGGVQELDDGVQEEFGEGVEQAFGWGAYPEEAVPGGDEASESDDSDGDSSDSGEDSDVEDDQASESDDSDGDSSDSGEDSDAEDDPGGHFAAELAFRAAEDDSDVEDDPMELDDLDNDFNDYSLHQRHP